MTKKRPTIALIYDFDGTLSPSCGLLCPAEYRAGKEINMVVKRILDKIKADYEFQRLLDRHHNKTQK